MDPEQMKMAREHFAQSWETLIFQDLSDDELETMGMVFGQIQAMPANLAVEQIAYNFGYIAAAQTARRRASEVTAEEPDTKGSPEKEPPVADPDAVPDFPTGETFGEHAWRPLEGDPDQTRCGYKSYVENYDKPVTCELPPIGVPHQRWIKNHPAEAPQD